jgi:PadR family transcriptional regulator AphA
VLRHALLGLLADRPMSGYELAQRFEASVGATWSAGRSTPSSTGSRTRG